MNIRNHPELRASKGKLCNHEFPMQNKRETHDTKYLYYHGIPIS